MQATQVSSTEPQRPLPPRRVNIVIDPAVTGNLAVQANNMDRNDLLAALAAAVGAEVQPLERGILRVVPRRPLPVDVTLVAENVPDCGTAVIELGDVKVTIDAPGTSDVRIWVANAPAFDVLRAAAVATGRTFVRTDTGYAIR